MNFTNWMRSELYVWHAATYSVHPSLIIQVTYYSHKTKKISVALTDSHCRI